MTPNTVTQTKPPAPDWQAEVYAECERLADKLVQRWNATAGTVPQYLTGRRIDDATSGGTVWDEFDIQSAYEMDDNAGDEREYVRPDPLPQSIPFMHLAGALRDMLKSEPLALLARYGAREAAAKAAPPAEEAKPKTPRHRYTFADRKTAEEVAERNARERDAALLALSRALNLKTGLPPVPEGIQWINPPRSDMNVGDHYRVGNAGPSRADGGAVVVVFSTGAQSDSVTVYPAGNVRDIVRSIGTPSNAAEENYRDVLTEAARIAGY